MYSYTYIYISIYIHIYTYISYIYDIYIYIYQLCVSLFENLKSQFIQKDILFKRSYISVCSRTFRETYKEEV